MPVPATNGLFRTKLEDMKIGDYIACKYIASSDQAGFFTDLGADLAIAQASEIPVSSTISSPNGYFYFIKVDGKGENGLFIADRTIQTNISWNTLNNSGYIDGNDFFKFLYEKKFYGSSILNKVINLKTTSLSYQGSNVLFNSFPIIPTGIVEIEYEAYLTGYHSSAMNSYIQLITEDLFNSRESQYGAFTTGDSQYNTPVSIVFNYDMPPQNVWQTIKHVVDFDNKTITTYCNGMLFNADNSVMRVNTITGSKLYLVLGVGSYSYASNNSYKNLKVSQQGHTEELLNSYIVRCPSCGLGYADVNGNLIATDFSEYGAFPVGNEWDKYIVNSSLNNKIIRGDNNVWHFIEIATWGRETTIVGYQYYDAYGEGISSYVGSATKRIIRANASNLKKIWQGDSTLIHNNVGFRPVLEFKKEG